MAVDPAHARRRCVRHQRLHRPERWNDLVEEHTKEMLGLEEVYVVLSGRALFTIDDEALDAPAGTAVFVRDPARENEDFSSLRERADWPLA